MVAAELWGCSRMSSAGSSEPASCVQDNPKQDNPEDV